MDELIAEVEKVNAELAGKLRAAHATEIDTHKGTASSAEKKLKALERERDKFKADLDAASKGQDEAAKLVQQERDKLAQQLEQATSALAQTKLRTKIEKKLGISDEKWSARVLDAFLKDYAEGVELDDKGALVGADAAIEAFRAAEPLWFAPPAPADEKAKPAVRGAAPSPAKPVGPGGQAKTERERINERKEELKARNVAWLPGKRQQKG